MTARGRSRAPWLALAVATWCLVLALVYRSGLWALVGLIWALVAAVELPHEPPPAPPVRQLDPELCGADVLGFACTRPAGHTLAHVSASRELAALVEACYGADQATVDGLVAECASTAELTDAEVDRLRWALGDPDINDNDESRIDP